MTAKLSPSMEDYLEAISFIGKKHGVARVKDISALLDVKRPSVTSALKVLERKGFIAHERYGHIELTESGEEAAGNIKKRHDLLIKFLADILRVRPETALKDACLMEHSMSPETFNALRRFVKLLKNKGGRKWKTRRPARKS